MTTGFLVAVQNQPSPATWYPVKVGAGGYMTGIDIANDDTLVCRSDVAPAFILEGSYWRNLITPSTIGVQDDRGGGVWEIAIAPNNSSIIYIAFQGDVWRSADRGNTFTATGLNFSTRPLGQTDANSVDRFMGQKMRVDPRNPNHVLIGTRQNGVYRTTDGGTTWAQISTAIIPACATTFSGVNPGHPGISFDPTSGLTGSNTGTIYVPVYGTGVYQSTDGGSTWSALTLTGSPTQISHGRVSNDGIYYCSNVSSNSANQFYKYSAGTWTNITSGSSVAQVSAINSILPDRNDATGARVICIGAGGSVQLNTGRGASGSFGSALSPSKTSPDIPWMAWTNETYMSLGDMVMDSTSNIWFAEGIGIWTVPFSGSPGSLTWRSVSRGIENLDCTSATLPPNGRKLLGGWDRSVFSINDPRVYPSTHSPNNATSIRHAWTVDWASSDPTFIAYNSYWSNLTNDGFGWYSTDSGGTWTKFLGVPISGNYNIGGSIAVSTSQNIIIVPANDSNPYYTKDGGATWTEITISGVPSSGETGWNHAYFNKGTRTVCADRVAANTFYMYNYVNQKTYSSSDGGDTWTASGSTTDTFASVTFQLKSVPGKQGHLFLSGGNVGNAGDSNPGSSRLQRSTDGGSNWSQVGAASGAGAIREPKCVGFGAAKPGQSYPAVYFVGWLNVAGTYVYAIWRSYDNCSTWENLGNYPINSLATFRDIDGSKESYGEVYGAYGAQGFIYRTAD